MRMNFWKSKGWSACGIALVAFVAGSLLTARMIQIQNVTADSNRVFELRVYHPVPGKMPALETRFRNTTSKILARHNLDVLGYWVSETPSNSENALIWIVAHPNWEEGQRNWDEMRSDPKFQKVIKAEEAEKLVEKVEVTHMRPTDFSPAK